MVTMSKAAVEIFVKKLSPLCDQKQKIIAKKAGISRTFLNRVLRGRAIPSLEIAENIANAAGLSLSEAITSRKS